MKGIREKIMKPVRLLVIIFVVCTLLQLFSIYRISSQVKSMENVSFATLEKADELKLGVVQVQQWLTDISATRAAEGYDDGLTEAAAYADRVRSIVGELKQLDADNTETLDGILSSFEAYYATGVEMANAYIEDGPVGGNVMMAEFDGVAQDINDRVDAYSRQAETAISRVSTGISATVMQTMAFAVAIVVLTLLLMRFVQRIIITRVVKPIGRIQDMAGELARGNLQAELAYESDDEVGRLALEMKMTMDALNGYIREIGRCMQQMEQGNLTVTTEMEFQGDFVALKQSLLNFVEHMNRTMREINTSAERVFGGSGQISDVAKTLAEGAAEQNRSMEQLSDGMNGMSNQVRMEADTAKEANRLMQRIGTEAKTSMEQMKQMVEAMEQIQDSSNQIGAIIQSIEGIASQTNLLSLNASIEAARAGEAGRGFAVVANEVAGLAGESANAVGKTTDLIQNSRSAVEKGTRIAQDTAQSLSIVEKGIQEALETIERIAHISEEQASAFTGVSTQMTQISDIVTTVSATAQESEATSEELRAQAEQMNGLVGRFRLQ